MSYRGAGGPGAIGGGDFGAVASTHWLATATAMAVLERGGNAFDAAIAGAFVLQVAEPDQNSLGGEVAILLWSASERRVRVICGQGPTPGAARPETFRRLGHRLIPGSGVLPACVPGAFDAWMRLLRDFGTWSVGDVLEYAIGYASRGVPVTPGLSARLSLMERHFRDHWVSSAEIYLSRGVPSPGDRLKNPPLAAMLAGLVRAAVNAAGSREHAIDAVRHAWREGFVAEAMFSWLAGRVVRNLEGGDDEALLTADDWASYRARQEDAVETLFMGVTFAKAGPWSQGPLLIQTLNMLAQTEIASMPHNTTTYIHTVVEATKLALADREAWYGDPDFSAIPLDGLLDPSYAQERAKLISPRASLDLRPGSPNARTPRLPAPTAGERDARSQRTELGGRGGDTSHIDVIDRFGNAITAMPSGGWLQSSPAIPALGFALGTRAQTMWLEDGLPNSLAPRKRPRTTLSPTLALRDDIPLMAFGSPGGDAQDQWGLQFLLGHLFKELALQEAADAPTFQSHHVPQSFWPRDGHPGALDVEATMDASVIQELRGLGHIIQVVPPRSQGWACAVHRDLATSFLSAAASRRGGHSSSTVR